MSRLEAHSPFVYQLRQYVLMATPEHLDPSRAYPLPEGADRKAANADSVTAIPPPKSAIPTTRNVLTAGLVTGATASLVCLLMRIVAWAFRADFLATIPVKGHELTPVPWQAVVLVPLLAALLGSFAAAAFLGIRHAQAIVFVLGTAVALISLVAPLFQDGTTWPTRIWLVLMHVATWAIVVPQVARIVGDSDPAITASFREDSPTEIS